MSSGDTPSASQSLPIEVRLPGLSGLYGESQFAIKINPGTTAFVGPNGTGKTQALRALTEFLRNRVPKGRKIRFIAAGRSAPLEAGRGSIFDPTQSWHQNEPAVGHQNYIANRLLFESLTGDLLGLQERADLKIKVESRLEALFGRTLRLQWSQSGLRISFLPRNGKEYKANFEASGLIHIIGLLAAIHDDETAILLIDEPEVSLHPQLQAFLLSEIQRAAGNPFSDSSKKIVVLATHSPSLLPVRTIGHLANVVFFFWNYGFSAPNRSRRSGIEEQNWPRLLCE